MPGGRVRVSIELVIVDVVAGPPYGSFDNSGVLGGSSDVMGLGRSPSKGHPKVDKAGAVRDEALWAGRNLVSLLMCFCSEPIDVCPRPLIPLSESLFVGSKLVFSSLEGGGDLLGDFLYLFLCLPHCVGSKNR